MVFQPGHGPRRPAPLRSPKSTVTGVGATPDPSTPLSRAADAADQTPLLSLRADWGRDGYLNPLADLSDAADDVSINRAATGDLPTEVSLVEGYVSAELTATLGGTLADDVTDTLDALAPYRADSPLYQMPLLGVPVTCDMGLATDQGPQTVRQFTGQVRSLRPSSSGRTVELAALDPADLLRAPITLPAYAQNLAEVLTSNHKFEASTQSVIDYVLRKNGIYASPPSHPQAQISCTGHGWLAAEAGRNAVPRGFAAVIPDDSWWVDDGPFGMQAVRGFWVGSSAYQEFFARERFTPVGGTGIGIAAWMRIGNDMGVPAGYKTMFQTFPLIDNAAFRFEVGVDAGGQLWGAIGTPSGLPGLARQVTTSTAWRYCGAHFQLNTDGTTTIRLRVDGTTTSGTLTTPGMTSGPLPFLQVTAWLIGADWSNFQVWYDPAPPSGDWPGEVHTSQADLDPGYNRMTNMPDVVNADSLTVIKDAAAAEFGLVGFDQTGRFYFRSRSSSTTPGTVERTITADTSLLDFGLQESTDSVRNVVTIEATASYLTLPSVIAESQDVTQFQSASGVWTYDVPLTFGAIGTTTAVLTQILSANWTSTSFGYVAVRADLPGTEITSGVTVVVVMAADRLAKMAVYNYSGFPVRFATTSGSPAMRIPGWGLAAKPTVLAQVKSNGSIATYGQRTLPIAASPYRQLLAPLTDVAAGMLAELSNPLPVIDQIPVNGDPGVGIGDTVRLVDPQGNGSLRANVVQITRKLSGGVLSDALTVRAVNPPGLGISDDLELGLADSTLIAAP